MALARRHLLQPLSEPLYEFQDVPRCSKKSFDEKTDPENSNAVVVQIKDRDEWIEILPELLLLCNEAATRFEIKAKQAYDAWKEKARRILKISSAVMDGNGLTVSSSNPVPIVSTPETPISDRVLQTPGTRSPGVKASTTVNGTENDRTLSNGNTSTVNAPHLPLHSGKPLSFEYIADRMDLDDPLHGYLIRDKATGWLQGFITVTTFTTWQKWFRWDSHVDEAGLLLYKSHGRGVEALHELGANFVNHNTSGLASRSPDSSDIGDSPRKQQKVNDLWWWEDRLVDADGSLAAALNGELRDGDPNSEGVIWPRVAELSLLGAIGCGSFLVDLIVEELEQEDSPYNFIVLQATENSVPFYESRGFVRVGAVARYHTKNLNGDDEEVRKGRPKSTSSATQTMTSTDMSQNLKESMFSSEDCSRGLMDHLEYNGKGHLEGENRSVFPEVEGASSHFYWYTVSSSPNTIDGIAKELNLLKEDIVFMNRRMYNGLTSSTQLDSGSLIRVPIFPKGVDPSRCRDCSVSEPVKAKDTWQMVSCDSLPGQVSSSKLFYTANENETPARIAKLLNVPILDLVAVNRSLYPGLMQRSNLKEGTVLRIPGRRPAVEGKKENDVKLHNEIQMDWGYVSSEKQSDDDISSAMCYRHWAFSDDPVALTHASYMMARPLKRNSRTNSTKIDSKIKIKERLLSKSKPSIFAYNLDKKSKKNAVAHSQSQVKNEAMETKGRLNGLNALPNGADTSLKRLLNMKVKIKCASVSRKKLRLRLGPFSCSIANDFGSARKRRKVQLKSPSNVYAGLIASKVSLNGVPIPSGLLCTLNSPLKPSTSDAKMESQLKKNGLTNKVVRLLPKTSAVDRESFFHRGKGAVQPEFQAVLNHKAENPDRLEENYSFYYVLTYIPDIKWVRLAPMEQKGYFPKNFRGCGGRSRWTLVPSSRAREIDVSAQRCVAVRSRAVKKTRDADKEEWALC